MSLNTEQTSLIRKLVLLNAVKHGGKANPGSIVGGVLGDFPDLKQDMKALMQEINAIVKEINSLDETEQKDALLEIDPEALDKKQEERDIFAFLKILPEAKIRTAFPPGPEKYPHIGHAKAAILNFKLAKQFKSEFYLRFEDTNPDLVKEEFYKIIQDDLHWLGVTWDKLLCASDYMQLYYDHAEKLLKQGNAYYCTCTQEQTKEHREKGKECKCRSNSPEQNVELWKAMPNQEQGAATIRLKIDMNHKNTTMRDPAMFRINKTPHARHKDKYAVWPTYDFQNSIMDGHFEITHRLRSKEWEMRSELQKYIQGLLGYKPTTTYEFARFNLEGVESSGRKIREGIQEGRFLGWDDPSLTTLAALRRRGFQPEAIAEFVVKTGMTKNEATLTWDDLIVHNKRFLDEHADRHFFVESPVKITIKNAPRKKFQLNLHPTNKKGGRDFETHEDFLITKKDKDSLMVGEIYRLMECLNFKVTGKDEYEFVDESIDTYRSKGKGMLHYLPDNAENVEITVMLPDKTVAKGLAESSTKNVKEGEVIQFERFGFARLDDRSKNSYWFTH